MTLSIPVFDRLGGQNELALPTYDEFFEGYLRPNRPCLLTLPLNPAFYQWTVPDPTSSSDLSTRSANRKPNYGFLKAKYGTSTVHPTGADAPMDFKQFLVRMEQGDNSMYLKDWHFVLEHPNVGANAVYEVPLWFGDDWLNEFLDDQGGKDDYRFVYMGASGTCTPLHVDVFTSYSWSANLCGTKKWTFFPPSQAHFFTTFPGCSITDLRLISPETHPTYYTTTTPITVYQHPGELIFVPSGWWHQVENIGETISINHNWCNACNLQDIYRNLASDLAYIRESIAEFRDEMGEDEWSEHCQSMLKANNAGFGYDQLWHFCQFHAKRLMRLLAEPTHDIAASPWETPKCILFSVGVLLEVWQTLVGDEWAQWKLSREEIDLTTLEDLKRTYKSTAGSR
ncbi:uncharacterized protein SPPG_08517 [Spizellomyces punctatus DAOM BR117]|uniref:JmjC domain-containing protein n=1 Tax=Spizellomyces punctatus (strain DAOM BR117) TaxID=645134 RepID=A0A0L0H3T3_SPIPD|nr:uncharacterized protein SPPG_08517 [Spizellomyces punctatus DAOM BR117]KNC96130.1 hypothetical protein SPPG_08517 [Spizellomyces punctatus DAOM BR117]|eukprot:XP_016604170.1 hypothetical protein SPPG_08517 [Spizellomyces punctatus DAOM BR117]